MNLEQIFPVWQCEMDTQALSAALSVPQAAFTSRGAGRGAASGEDFLLHHLVQLLVYLSDCEVYTQV